MSRPRVTERVPAAEWLALSPEECRKAVMKHTMHAWKTGTLASNGRMLSEKDRRQAVGMGMSKVRTACDSPRRMTAAQVVAFRADPGHNPLTGRAISPSGFTAQVLRAIAASSASVKAKRARSPSPTRRKVKAKAKAKTKAKAKAKTRTRTSPRR